MMENLDLSKFRVALAELEGDYDGEFDIVPGGPTVTSTDMELINICRQLLVVIDVLQDRILKLHSDVESLSRSQKILFDDRI